MSSWADSSLWDLIVKSHDKARNLSYSGVLTTQVGSYSQSSRLSHYVDSEGEFEELVKLDGQPSKWIRHNDDIQCVLPDQKLIISEKRLASTPFPHVFSSPAGLRNTEQVYSISELPPQRVADRNTLVFRLEPKDKFRHEYRLFVDKATNLLLRTELYSSDGHLLEQVGFSEIDYKPDPAKKPSMYALQPGWHEASTQVSKVDDKDLPYSLPKTVAGFEKTDTFCRVKPDNVKIHQTVYSDGMSTLSVFVQKARPDQKMPTVPVMHGAVMSKSEVVGDKMVTVLGEVPVATLDQFLKSVQWKMQ